MILTVINASYVIAYIEAWKIQDFNGVWTRDLATPVRLSSHLSYEANVKKPAFFVAKSLDLC